MTYSQQTAYNFIINSVTHVHISIAEKINFFIIYRIVFIFHNNNNYMIQYEKYTVYFP